MHASIDRLLSFKPEAIYLTHYGQVVDVEHLGMDLHRRLDALVDSGKQVTGKGEQRHQTLKGLLTNYLFDELLCLLYTSRCV